MMLLNGRFKKIIVGSLVGIIILALIIQIPKNGSIKDPAKDKLLRQDEGKEYAAIYNFGEFFIALGEDESVLRLAQNDILLFARATMPNFNDLNRLVGFTFTEGPVNENDYKIFKGRYYGSSDKIKISALYRGKGVATLSITNEASDTNIDDYLSLNGPKNKFLSSLPIENENYSIRYQLREDRVVVTFYDNYSSADVDQVENTLKKALGISYAENTIFSINKIGILDLTSIRQNLVAPLPN